MIGGIVWLQVHGVGNFTATHCYKKASDVMKKRALRRLAFNYWGRVGQWMIDTNNLIGGHNLLATGPLTPAIIQNAQK